LAGKIRNLLRLPPIVTKVIRFSKEVHKQSGISG
jgi:hypothetical protein